LIHIYLLILTNIKMLLSIINFIFTSLTSVVKNSSKFLTGVKKVASKLTFVPKYTFMSVKKIYKIFKGNSTIIRVGKLVNFRRKIFRRLDLNFP